MEYEIDKIITCKYNNKNVTLKVTPTRDSTCAGCFFYQDYKSCCFNTKNVIGYCEKYNRKDKTSVIFEQINNKTMNKNIDLTKILKNCPKGWKFYTPIWGEVTFNGIKGGYCGICIDTICGCQILTIEGYYIYTSDAECIIFPSKDQRDWNKFTAPWYKIDKFDPKTLKPFDKVLVRNSRTAKWKCEHFSYFKEGDAYPYMASTLYTFCVPYNDDTKHLVGTDDEAPEYYKYWED